MPPQRDENDAATDKASDNASGTAGSYWEAPDTEESLKGKTLSTLDMSALESNHPEQQEKKKDDYWEATPEKTLEGKTLSTLDMSLLGTPSPAPVPPAKTTKPSPTVTAEEPKDSAPSYWDDAPIDKSLQGKRLSSLDVSALASNHPDAQQEKGDDYWGGTPKEETLKGKTLSTLSMSQLESNHPDEQVQKKEDYWSATPEDGALKGKTLSTLSMSAMVSNHPDDKKQQTDNYWEAPEEEKLKGKRLSTLDLNTLESTGEPGSASTSATEESAMSYWDEAPARDSSLQGQRLSQIDLEALSKQHVDADHAKKQRQSDNFWEWQGVKGIKKTLSKMSMSNLRKGSRDVVLDDDDCVHGGTHGVGSSRRSSGSISSSNSGGVEAIPATVKPITQKKHKLRDSWRKSFQKMSTNTLDQLDESTGSGPRLLGKRMFKSRSSASTNILDMSTGSASSQFSAGSNSEAPMF